MLHTRDSGREKTVFRPIKLFLDVRDARQSAAFDCLPPSSPTYQHMACGQVALAVPRPRSWGGPKRA